MIDKRKTLLTIIKDKGKCKLSTPYPQCMDSCPAGEICMRETKTPYVGMDMLYHNRLTYCITRYTKNYGEQALKDDLVEELL